MKTKKILLIALLGILFYTNDSFSHNGWFHQGSCDWKSENNWRGTREVIQENTEVTQGEVLSIDMVPSLRGRGNGVHLVIKTDEETLCVLLGPEWYISKLPVSIEPGDFVEVIGKLVVYEGDDALVAYQITVDDEIFKLREGNGVPVWSRRGRR